MDTKYIHNSIDLMEQHSPQGYQTYPDLSLETTPPQHWISYGVLRETKLTP